MGQQHNKTIKRRRRKNYLARKKETAVKQKPKEKTRPAPRKAAVPSAA